MREPLRRAQIQDYLAARARAQRYMRDSSPPLTKKGLAAQLQLEQSAFNKFLNGTIFADAEGHPLRASALDQERVFLRAKWTEKRLARFIERVETECWRLGIANRPNPKIPSAARTEAERIRVSKHYQFVCDIKDSAELSLPSALLFWEVAAQEAVDARAHLRPTMCVNALVALGDLVDRKSQGKLCTQAVLESGHGQRLAATVEMVRCLIRDVHRETGSPCLKDTATKSYECYHKAHGYGGYDLYFLGWALNAARMQAEGVGHLLEAIGTTHHPNDGHVANTATVIELALDQAKPQATTWASAFCKLIRQRLETDDRDPACYRLLNMKIPHLYRFAQRDLFSMGYFRNSATVRLQMANQLTPSAEEGAP